MIDVDIVFSDAIAYIAHDIYETCDKVTIVIDLDKPFLAAFRNSKKAIEENIAHEVAELDSITSAPLKVEQSENVTHYHGPIVLSSGLIPVHDGRIILHKRGAGTRFEPNKWQEFVGRCSSEPYSNAIREFYEELLIISGNSVIVPDIDGIGKFIYLRENVYRYTQTLIKLKYGIDIYSMEKVFVETRRMPELEHNLRDLYIVMLKEGEPLITVSCNGVFASPLPQYNTYEIRYIREIELPEEYTLYPLEPISSSVKEFSVDELVNMKDELAYVTRKFVEFLEEKRIRLDKL